MESKIYAVLEIKAVPKLRADPFSRHIVGIASCLVGATYLQYQAFIENESLFSNADANDSPYETLGAKILCEQIGWYESDRVSAISALKNLFAFWKGNKVKCLLTYHDSEYELLDAECAKLGLSPPPFVRIETLPFLRRPENHGKRNLTALYKHQFPAKNINTHSLNGGVIAQAELIETYLENGYISMLGEEGKCQIELDPISKAFKECDADDNGEISKEEFEKWYRKTWEGEFKLADANKDDTISF